MSRGLSARRRGAAAAVLVLSMANSCAAFAPSAVQSLICFGRPLSSCASIAGRSSASIPRAVPVLGSSRRAAGRAGCLGVVSQQAMDATAFAAKSEVLAALADIQDPFRGDSLVKLGAVKELVVDSGCGTVSASIILGAPDLQGEVKSLCIDAIKAISWVEKVDITMAALPPQDELREASKKMATGLIGVKNVVACASCKGGVGKSTTSVNLAYSLKAKGYKVGIFDVDVYGPSLPTMVHPDRQFNPEVDIVGNAITPPERDGVKLMSVGFINPVDSFVLRGAKVSPLVQQLVSTTQWGDLDYLIIDMPPGTGDIHLTLSQMEDFKIDAAVIVTTPQRLSFIDVVKGVEMFDKVGIPSIAVVENMAYLDADPETKEKIASFAAKHSLSAEAVEELEGLVAGGGGGKIFGDGHRQRLLEMWGIENSYSMPLSPAVASQGDSGTPYVVAHPQGAVADQFGSLADAVVKEVASLKEGGKGRPEVVFDRKSGDLVVDGKQRIKPIDLRRLCRSPANDPKRVPEGLVPTSLIPLGKYALSIVWSDGHQSLMPYRAFVDGYEG